MKYYHASTKHWKVGDVITVQHWRRNSFGAGIYVSTAPELHSTLTPWKKNDKEPKRRIYRVIPLGKVLKGYWGDLVCMKGVQVVESLGETPTGKMSKVTKSGKPKIIRYERRKHEEEGDFLGRVTKKPRYVVHMYVKGEKVAVKGFRDLKKAQAFIKKYEKLQEEYKAKRDDRWPPWFRDRIVWWEMVDRHTVRLNYLF